MKQDRTKGSKQPREVRKAHRTLTGTHLVISLGDHQGIVSLITGLEALFVGIQSGTVTTMDQVETMLGGMIERFRMDFPPELGKEEEGDLSKHVREHEAEKRMEGP